MANDDAVNIELSPTKEKETRSDSDSEPNASFDEEAQTPLKHELVQKRTKPFIVLVAMCAALGK